MIIVWVIGLILSFLGIYLLKGSRRLGKLGCYGQVRTPDQPILKVWSLFFLLLGAIVPILNILMGLIIIVLWAISVYGEEDWTYSETSIVNKVVQLLNKPIK